MNSAFKQFRFIHWVMAIGYLVLLILGLLMTNVFNQGGARSVLYTAHTTLGVFAIALLSLRVIYLLRISWQKYSRRLPRWSVAWFRLALLHTVLYLMMWAVPMTGLWLANSSGSHKIALFGFIPVPDVFPPNPDHISTAYALHERFAYLLTALSLFHLFEQRKTALSLWKRSINYLTTTRHR